MKKLSLVFAALSVLAISSPSHAGWLIGVDLGVTIPVGDGPDRDPGYGLNVRVGHDWNLAILKVAAEISGGHHTLGGPNGVTLTRAMAGARLALGVAVEPYLYAHFGYGRINGGPEGASYDAGGGISYSISKIRLGLQAGYNACQGIRWIDAGARAELSF